MRPKDQRQTQKLITRWGKLLKAVRMLMDQHTRPLSNAQRKAMCVICGRILNIIVCTFDFSDELLNLVTQSLDVKLMRMQTHDDVLAVHALETTALRSIVSEIKAKIETLERLREQ